MKQPMQAGSAAIETKGWFAAHRWLLLRRTSQLSILLLFLLGPLAGIWILKGNLNSSLVLNTLPLSDPLILLQSLLAGHSPQGTALLGAAIVLVFYLLVGGRVFCSFVCPLNLVTDGARYLARRLGLPKGWRPSRNTRFWLLAGLLLAALLSNMLAWELVNPVSIVQRGLIYGMGAAWLVVLLIFVTDLLLMRRGWCGHLCPVGAFYSLLGRFSLLRVSARARSACNDCMDCYAVCPEPHVIAPALHGAAAGNSPLILSGDCSNCGRCIDVCAPAVFRFDHRFNKAGPESAEARLNALKNIEVSDNRRDPVAVSTHFTH